MTLIVYHILNGVVNITMIETNEMALCLGSKRKGKNDYGKDDEYKNRGGTHLQRKSGRWSMLSVIISMNRQRKQCRRRSTE